MALPIPESQLDTWSHQGSITQSSQTYQIVRDVLTATDTPYSSRPFKVFLQGSYGNDTNIYAESDVDVVIRLDECWATDLTALPPEDKSAFERAFVTATYGHPEFRADVLGTLVKAFAPDVRAQGKAIAIGAKGNRRKSDVIAAIEFRRYHRFRSIYDQSYDSGICFWSSAGAQITNYPDQHRVHLSAKHQLTREQLKPMIRLIKNIRTRLVDEGAIDAEVAPSYYIEGLLYNVPNHQFVATYSGCLVNALRWIREATDKSEWVCANEQYYLIRDTVWPQAHCDAFVDAVVSLWNDW